MAILTALRPDEIERVTAAFGVDMVEAKGVLAGSVNTSFTIVDGRGRRFWLRVYEEQDHTGASREARLLTRLAAAGVSTPAPLPLSSSFAGAGEGDGRFVTTVRDKPVCLFPFVEGKHRCQASVTPADVEVVGKELARVHLVGADFPAADMLTVASRFSMSAIRERLAVLRAGDLQDDVRDSIARLLPRAAALEAAPVAAPPLPLIHGDLFRDNVLFGEAGVSLLDFESASIGSAAFDLMVTILAWCFGDTLDLGLARSLVGAYEETRTLSHLDAGDLQTQGRIACVRFAATRITDYETRSRGLGVYKDFRRFLARLEWLEQVGADLPSVLEVRAA
jgi:homoserine kinase type II